MKNIITVAALLAAGTAFADSSIANLGNGILGSWTEYNLQDSILTETDSVTLPESWGGPTAWITLDTPIDLGRNQVLTFSYEYSYSQNNGIYSISFLGAGGEPAFMIGNTEYAKRDLAAAVAERGTSGFHQDLAQSLRFNPGNSADRIQSVSSDGAANLGVVSPGCVTATIAYDVDLSGFLLRLESDGKSAELSLGDRVAFDTISFSGDADDSQQLSSISMRITSVPEPSAFGLLAGLGALALVAARRRRRKA